MSTDPLQRLAAQFDGAAQAARAFAVYRRTQAREPLPGSPSEAEAKAAAYAECAELVRAAIDHQALIELLLLTNYEPTREKAERRAGILISLCGDAKAAIAFVQQRSGKP
jgi:hypothetical protein